MRTFEPPQYQADLDAEAAPRRPSAAADRDAAVPDLGGAARGELDAAPLRRKASGSAAVTGDAARAVAEQGFGDAGHELPHRAAMEAQFGTGLGEVSAHTGANAQSASRSIGAEAYTIGNQIGFATASPSQDTVAHEVTHVLQQTSGGGARSEAEDEAEARTAEHGAAPTRTGGAGGATALRRQEAVAPATEGLSAAAVRTAIAFNRGRGLPVDAWDKIATVVGASGPEIDAELVQAIGRWQESQGLGADGKVGNITLQWLSQRPGGAGLETLVQSDATVFLGLNPGSRGVELETLKSTGADVTGITGARTQDSAQVAGRTVDLNSEDGLTAFLAQFPRLDASAQAALASFLDGARGSSKDELAELVKIFYSAETGARLIKRMVLSGHSGGWSFWGDDNGSIQFSHMTQLGAIFPNALGQVEDLMLSACNTAQSAKLDQYTAIFPNLKSIWGYVGYSPSAATGSTRHIKEWEKGSRGAMKHDKLDASRERVSDGSGPRDQNVALWTRDGAAAAPQYETDSPEASYDYATLRAAVDGGLSSYHDAFDRGVIDLASLSALYTQMQGLTGNHQGSLGGDYDHYVLMMKHVLFLRHWSGIQSHFWAEHGAEVQAAYGDAAVPNYRTGTRTQVLAAIAAFPGDRSSAAYLALKEILHDLDPARIPDNWI